MNWNPNDPNNRQPAAYPPQQPAPAYPPQQPAPAYPPQQPAPAYPPQQPAAYPPQQPAAYPPQQPAPTQTIDDLPDGAEVRNVADRTPFLPSVPCNLVVHVLGVFVKNGFQSGTSYRVKVKILASDQPQIPVGGTFELYRAAGANDMHKRFSAQWLCQLTASILKRDAGDPNYNWKTDLGGLIGLGVEIERSNVTICVSGVEARDENGGVRLRRNGTPIINYRFSQHG